jgi:hypothetical protein
MVHPQQVNPLLRRIEALNDIGGYTNAGEYVDSCDYTATFLLPDGGERAIMIAVAGSEVSAPAANLIPGWPSESESFQAVLAAVRAVHLARTSVSERRPSLLDVPGGWDVGLGNITLSDNGIPTCVSHGELAVLDPSDGSRYECEACGASAIYAPAPRTDKSGGKP